MMTASQKALAYAQQRDKYNITIQVTLPDPGRPDA